MADKHAWTEENVATLKAMWGKQSANEIASALGDFTRNSVIGKAHRLGLAKQPSPIKRKISAKPNLLSLSHHACKWPFGDPKKLDFHFCGEKVDDPTKPYCHTHHQVAYAPRRPAAAQAR